MKISTAHQHFICATNTDAETNPEKYLGPNYQAILNFWLFLDNYSSQDIRERVAGDSDIPFATSYIQLIKQKAEIITNNHRYRVYQASHETHGDLRIVGLATWELVSMHELLQEGHELQFIPLFQNL